MATKPAPPAQLTADVAIPEQVHKAYPGITEKLWNEAPAEDKQRLIQAADAAGQVQHPGILSAIGQSAEHLPQTIEGAAKYAWNAVGGNPPAPGAKAKPKAKTAKAPTQQQLNQQVQAASLWNNLGQELVKSQEALAAPVQNAVSGGLTAPAESNAASTALGALGLSPSSGAAKWLSSEMAQANANDSPMTAAMNAYGKAYGAGQKGIDAALGGMGQANALAVQTAPEADWVQALAQHVMSNVNYYGEISPAVAAGIPPALQYYLGQSGGGGAAATGAIPITDTPAQWSQAIKAYENKTPVTGATSLPSSTQAAAGATATGVSGLPPGTSNAAGT